MTYLLTERSLVCSNTPKVKLFLLLFPVINPKAPCPTVIVGTKMWRSDYVFARQLISTPIS